MTEKHDLAAFGGCRQRQSRKRPFGERKFCKVGEFQFALGDRYIGFNPNSSNNCKMQESVCLFPCKMQECKSRAIENMHIIKRAKLVEFWERKENNGSEPVLDAWYRTMKKGAFENIAQIREVYRHADIVGECVVFNVGTNKYRVVTKIYFTEKTLLIRFVMTHKEYDTNAWKKDC